MIENVNLCFSRFRGAQGKMVKRQVEGMIAFVVQCLDLNTILQFLLLSIHLDCLRIPSSECFFLQLSLPLMTHGFQRFDRSRYRAVESNRYKALMDISHSLILRELFKNSELFRSKEFGCR